MAKTLMSKFNHKLLATAIIGVLTFFGLEVLSYTVGIYQIDNFFTQAFFLYAFLVFWLIFIFDIHIRDRAATEFLVRIEHILNIRNFGHLVNSLVLPGLVYWPVVVLMFLNPFSGLIKQILVVTGSISLTFIYWYFTQTFSEKLEAHDLGLKILNLVKVYSAFLVFAASLGTAWYFGLGQGPVFQTVFLATFLLLFQALFQHRMINLKTDLWLILASLLIAGFAVLIFDFWNRNYFSGALVVAANYNLIWSLLHHYLEKNLTNKLAWEYILMTAVLISLVAVTQNFSAQIGFYSTTMFT